MMRAATPVLPNPESQTLPLPQPGLSALLLYHFVPGAVIKASLLKAASPMPTAESPAAVLTGLGAHYGKGAGPVYRVAGGVPGNVANVIKPDLYTGGKAAVVHILDEVLLPPNIGELFMKP